MRITAEDVVVAGGIEIDLDVVLIGIEGLSLGVAEIVLQAGTGRGGIQTGTKQSLCHRIDGLGNHVVRKWCVTVQGVIKLVSSEGRVVDGHRVVTQATSKPATTNVPEVPRALCCSKQPQLFGAGRMVKTLPLVVKKEEQLVLDYGTADRSPEHIPAQ